MREWRILLSLLGATDGIVHLNRKDVDFYDYMPWWRWRRMNENRLWSLTTTLASIDYLASRMRHSTQREVGSGKCQQWIYSATKGHFEWGRTIKFYCSNVLFNFRIVRFAQNRMLNSFWRWCWSKWRCGKLPRNGVSLNVHLIRKQ